MDNYGVHPFKVTLELLQPEMWSGEGSSNQLHMVVYGA
jgi:hypothetical protein